LLVEQLIGEPLREDGIVGIEAACPITIWPEVVAAVLGRQAEVKPSIGPRHPPPSRRADGRPKRPPSKTLIFWPGGTTAVIGGCLQQLSPFSATWG
jgi:hypothetical protein